MLSIAKCPTRWGCRIPPFHCKSWLFHCDYRCWQTGGLWTASKLRSCFLSLWELAYLCKCALKRATCDYRCWQTGSLWTAARCAQRPKMRHVFLIVVWAARYNTWLLIKLTPKGVVFSFRFFSFLFLLICENWLICANVLQSEQLVTTGVGRQALCGQQQGVPRGQRWDMFSYLWELTYLCKCASKWATLWVQVLADRQFVDSSKVCPEAKASFFSIITFGWISNLMRQGYRWVMHNAQTDFGMVCCMCESYFHHYFWLDQQPHAPRLQVSHAQSTDRFWNFGILVRCMCKSLLHHHLRLDQ